MKSHSELDRRRRHSVEERNCTSAGELYTRHSALATHATIAAAFSGLFHEFLNGARLVKLAVPVAVRAESRIFRLCMTEAEESEEECGKQYAYHL